MIDDGHMTPPLTSVSQVKKVTIRLLLVHPLLEVTCGSPVAPSGGSVDVNVGALPFSVGSEVTYRCDEGLFPAVDMISTCEVVSGVGTWRPDTSIVCRDGEDTIATKFMHYNYVAFHHRQLHPT